MKLHSIDNDYPLPGEPTNEVNQNLYEEKRSYRRDELIRFRLIELFLSIIDTWSGDVKSNSNS